MKDKFIQHFTGKIIAMEKDNMSTEGSGLTAFFELQTLQNYFIWQEHS